MYLAVLPSDQIQTLSPMRYVRRVQTINGLSDIPDLRNRMFPYWRMYYHV